MEGNTKPTAVRKLRKIKRPRQPENKPVTYGVPEKAVLPQTVNASDDYSPEAYFNNNGDAENIRFITEDDFIQNQPETVIDYLKNKTILLMLVLSVAFGIILGSTIFSGKDTTKRGLEGVVINSDVPMGRSRCGLAEPHQGCVLYIMNPHNQEVSGRDFFATAAQWTKRERYLIETGNMHYGSKRIRPGHIAQINIPPLSNQ